MYVCVSFVSLNYWREASRRARSSALNLAILDKSGSTARACSAFRAFSRSSLRASLKCARKTFASIINQELANSLKGHKRRATASDCLNFSTSVCSFGARGLRSLVRPLVVNSQRDAHARRTFSISAYSITFAVSLSARLILPEITDFLPLPYPV